VVEHPGIIPALVQTTTSNSSKVTETPGEAVIMTLTVEAVAVVEEEDVEGHTTTKATTIGNSNNNIIIHE
jgi:hypothetical protein